MKMFFFRRPCAPERLSDQPIIQVLALEICAADFDRTGQSCGGTYRNLLFKIHICLKRHGTTGRKKSYSRLSFFFSRIKPPPGNSFQELKKMKRILSQIPKPFITLVISYI